MTYTVVWSPRAERELSAARDAAPDAGAITQAVLGLNGLLRTDPDRVGESRAQGTRVVFVEPLGVVFQVRWREQTVRIVRVWRYRPRGRRS